MTPIPADEILPRAREAAVARLDWASAQCGEVRSGRIDDYDVIIAAAQALRDAHRPLSELVPAHPRLQEARELLAEGYRANGFPENAKILLEGKDDGIDRAAMQAILAAFDRIERGAK